MDVLFQLMKNLYKKCKLVHGDLSEYNLLWHNCRVYVIDVGQSVLIDQSNAMEFLHRDCNNIHRVRFHKNRLEISV